MSNPNPTALLLAIIAAERAIADYIVARAVIRVDRDAARLTFPAAQKATLQASTEARRARLAMVTLVEGMSETDAEAVPADVMDRAEKIAEWDAGY